jgi:serine/threonine protein kinase
LHVLDHPNIIKLYEIWEWNNVCFLVLEYCQGGELFNYIIEKQHLTEDVACLIMRQMLQALEYLHAKQISHRDIKP